MAATNFFGGAFLGGGFFGGSAPVVSETYSGGYRDHYARVGRFRTRKEIARDRKRFGLADDYIEEVAERQAEDLTTREDERREELRAELALHGIEMQAKHIKALNERRQKYIDAEIAHRLQMEQDDDDAIAIMLMAAH